ncbi:MAG: hypothetical protein ACE5DO_07545 [Desulfobacterales bacterium]
MKQIGHLLLILICVAAIVGCKAKTDSLKDTRNTESNVSESNEPPSSESTPAPPADSFEIVGTVTYRNIEGGFYAIDGDDGSKYDPVNLPESFRKDGLKVKVKARLKTDAVSLHMYGSIIDIVNIADQ